MSRLDINRRRMSLTAIEFIEKLEKSNYPTHIFEGGFFSIPFWYRRKGNDWEWSNDQIFWNSVHAKVDREIYYLSSDNIYIINYLRLKSKSKDIKDMDTHLETLKKIINNLYLNTSIVERTKIEDKYISNEMVQDYLNQMSFEKKLYENQLSRMTALELEYSQELNRLKTRNSQKSFDIQYNNQIDILKLEIIESRYKYNQLASDLHKYILEACNANDDLLLNYKLEDEVKQACRFLEGKDTYITNIDLGNAFANLKNRLLGILSDKSFLTNKSFDEILQQIKGEYIAYLDRYNICQNELDDIKKMNKLLKIDNDSVKREFNQLEKEHETDKRKLEILISEITKIKCETQSYLLRIGTLECQVDDLENIRSILIVEKEQMLEKLTELADAKIKLEAEKKQLENQNNNLIQKVLEKNPHLVFNNETNCFENREDTYEVINLEDE